MPGYGSAERRKEKRAQEAQLRRDLASKEDNDLKWAEHNSKMEEIATQQRVRRKTKIIECLGKAI